MDDSNTRKSDAAATRKRRSSILKSQRNVRAPLSELEFNVATPDQAKSRRVSFSRRTGVAEFEISEATTAWKNVYEEHNKSHESSANESGIKAAPRRVSHLGGRASHFEYEEADVIEDNEPSPPPTAQLDPTTTMNTLQFCQMDSLGLHEATNNLDVHFSSVAPLALQDDLDLLRQDLQLEPKRDDIDEISIDIDFNATHFSLKVEDDDMSITDTIRSPAVAATEKSQVDFLVGATKKSQDWTADKENIVINPYVAPPPAEFPCEEDILVFDGKRCKFQSKLDPADRVILPVQDENIPPNHKTMFLDDMTETQAIPAQILQHISQGNPQKTIVFGDGDLSITQAVPTNIMAPKLIEEDKENQKTMYFNDLADMSVTQALPADIILNEPQHSRTIVYGDDGHISMTQAVPGALLSVHKEEIGLANKLEDTRRKTIVYDNENVSITGVVPGNICLDVNALNTDRRKTIVYGNDDGNVSITGVVPANIIDEVKPEQPRERRTIVYDNDDYNVSMTRVLPSNIIDEDKLKEQDKNRRHTVVFGNDNGDLSITGVAPVNIIEAQQPNIGRRKTIVYGNDEGNISITGVVPANIFEANVAQQPNIDRRKTIVNDNDDANLTADVLEAKVNQQPNIDRRRTVVYGNEDGNISMTGVVPVNILEAKVVQQSNINRRKTKVTDNDNANVTDNVLEAKDNQQPNIDRRRTVVYGNEEGNISMTGVVPVNILEANVAQQSNIERRKTIVYNNDDGNVSMTGVVTADILEAKVDQQPNIDRRRTVVFENDGGDLSMTGVAPVNILEAKAQHPNIDRRKTIVYGNDDGNVSMTGVVTADILEAKVDQQPNIDRLGTVVFENDGGDLSMTGVAPVNILEAKAQHPNIDRRKTIVYGNDDGNVSMTGVVTADILEAKVDQQPNIDRRRTVVFENDGGDLSMTRVAPVNILEAKAQHPNIDRRKTIVYGNDDGNVSMTGVVTADIIDQATLSQQTNFDKRRTVVFGIDDGDLSITGVAPDNVLDGTKDQEPNADRRKTVVYGNDENNISMTGVVPAKILDKARASTDMRTIVYGADDGNVSTTKKIPSNILNNDVKAQPLNVEHRKTIADNDNDNKLSITVDLVNTVDETKQKGHKSVVYENDVKEQPEQPNGNRRKTVVFGDDDGNMSVTGIVPENILEVKLNQPFNEDRRKTIVCENEDRNVSITGVVPANIIAKTNVKQPNQSAIGVVLANMLDKEFDAAITHPNTDNRKTIVDENVSVVGAVRQNLVGDVELTQSPTKTVVYEDNDVSMTGLPAHTIPGDTFVTVPETLNSIVCEDTETRNNLLENFEEKDDQIEMIESITIPILIESDEDVFMQAVSRPESPNPRSTTFNKSLGATDALANQTFEKSMADPRSTTINKSMAGQNSLTLDKSLAGQICSTTFNKSVSTTFNKSLAATDALANQTFDKSLADPHSTTINKSMAGQNCSAFERSLANQECSTTFNKSSAGQGLSTTSNKSLAGQDQATFNKSLAGQETTINKTLTSQKQSTSMNKSANKVFVYGATTEVKDKNMTSYIEDLTCEDNQSLKSPDNASLALSKSSADRLPNGRSPTQSIEPKSFPAKHSVLDTLLDMSQSSVEDIPNECQSKTTSLPVSATTITNIPSSESYILVKDDEEVKDSELQTLEANEPIAVENKKQHGIVCRLQRKLSALKNVLHVKEKSPKKDTVIDTIENHDLPLLRKSSLRHSTSPPEKNKSVKIDLTARISIDNMDDDQNDNHTQVDFPSRIEERNEQQANTTKCQANDTRAILDALSEFTNTRRSGDFEPLPSPDKTRRTSAPDRKSMIISREDLLREISMAQVLMKSEMQQTEMELEASEGSSDEQDLSPHRVSREVVKTLRFEDDDSILESKILQKPSFAQNSPRRLSTVIPTYEISDPVKELMNDLIKPLADIEQPLFSKQSESSQANTLDSSQIDLIPSQPVLISPRSCLRQTQLEIAHSETHVTRTEPAVILFDHLNPLNNVLLPPVDQVEVHKYNPRRSEESISPSVDSRCCQTESEPSGRDVELGMVLVNLKVDRAVGLERDMKDSGVNTPTIQGSLPPHGILVNSGLDRVLAHERSTKDTEVNTSIVMKGNRELLAASSSLTLVDDALSHTDHVQVHVPARSPVRVIFQLDEPYSSVQLGSELTSDVTSGVTSDVTSELKSDVSPESRRKKRGHIPSKGPEYSPVRLGSQRSSISPDLRRNKRGHIPCKRPEVTPKPANKVQKVSNNAKARKNSNVSTSVMDSSVSDGRGSSVTVAPLYACARSDTSATDGSRVSVWRPELLHEPSSKNMVSEQEPGVNVVAKIDVLPFMGTSECEWESRAADTWSFLLLRARIRLVVRLEHRATNTTRVLVRADTPVRLVLVQHVMVDQERSEPVAALCVGLAADTLQRLSARGVARAGQVPALLRRCAAVVRVALRWGRVMRAARAALAFSLQDTGELSLKVANIPLRSVWEVTLRIELADKGGTPYPRATDLKVSRVVAAWAPGQLELEGLLETVLEDWGHVPRTIWKIFKYLKNKKPEDDLLIA